MPSFDPTQTDPSLATRLYIVRHGETDYNRHGVVQGRKIDSFLNTTGIEQAHALGRRFLDTRFDAVYASTLRRALQTAFIAARYQPVPQRVRRIADLAEMSWGVFEGRPLEEPDVRDGIERVKSAWARGLYDHPIEGGESVVQVGNRGRQALDRIVERHRGETVLVVTHGRFIRILLASLLEGYDLSRMEEIEHANTGVNLVVHEAGAFRPRFLNDTAHLNGAFHPQPQS